MAWNPSPEVQVARDAANRMSELHGQKVAMAVVLYITEDKIGYASYGINRQLCNEARTVADRMYRAARDHYLEGGQP